MKPIAYLMCGLPGSGKTTYAKELETQGVTRLSLDEKLFEKFGREYADHDTKQRETKDELRETLKEKIAAGQSAVVDFGFWKKADRDACKALVEAAGGDWKLLYFRAPKEILLERLAARNAADPHNNHVIDEAMLDQFVKEFEEPLGEGEIVIGQ